MGVGKEGREKQTGGWVGTRRRGGALTPSLDKGSRGGKDAGSAEVLLLAGACGPRRVGWNCGGVWSVGAGAGASLGKSVDQEPRSSWDAPKVIGQSYRLYFSSVNSVTRA